MYCEYEILICLFKTPKLPFKNALTENVLCLRCERPLRPSRRCARVTFTWRSPAQLLPSAASCPIRFVNRGVGMLNAQLAARWEGVVPCPAASEPSGEGQTFPVNVQDPVDLVGERATRVHPLLRPVIYSNRVIDDHGELKCDGSVRHDASAHCEKVQ
jgi:hypothetical protein